MLTTTECTGVLLKDDRRTSTPPGKVAYNFGTRLHSDHPVYVYGIKPTVDVI